jgi:hypothetical protein
MQCIWGARKKWHGGIHDRAHLFACLHILSKDYQAKRLCPASSLSEGQRAPGAGSEHECTPGACGVTQVMQRQVARRCELSCGAGSAP